MRKNEKKSKSNQLTKFNIFIGLLINFWNNIRQHIKNKTIRRYLQIIGLDPYKFSDIKSNDFNLESKNLAIAFFKYPTIVFEIFQCLFTKKSKIKFLDSYSEEQIKYITSPDISDSKLIACAGSGKTRCIIAE